MPGTEPFVVDPSPQKPRACAQLADSQVLRNMGEDFLAEALAQAYQDLDDAENHVERLELALRDVEEECAALAEDRQEMVTTVVELTQQVMQLRGASPAPAEAAPALVPPAPAVDALPVDAVTVVAAAPYPHAAQQTPAPQPVESPSAPAPAAAQPVRPRRSLQRGLARVSDWLWDEPPDELDAHVARSLRSRWRAGFVVAGLVALLALAGAAVAIGIPKVRDNLASQTAALEMPQSYSTKPLLLGEQ